MCELLFNSEPSVIALVYRNANTSPSDNISFICTLKTIISLCSDCVILCDSTAPKLTGFYIPPHQIQLIPNFWFVAQIPSLTSVSSSQTRFRVNQHPSLLDLIFVKFPHLISPISIHSPLGKSDHALLRWTSTSALPQLPPCPDKVSPTRISVQTITTLAFECRWEFPKGCSMNNSKASSQDQISLLTSKATAPPKAYKRPLHKPLYTRRVKRAIQRHRKAWKNSESISSCDAAYLRLQLE